MKRTLLLLLFSLLVSLAHYTAWGQNRQDTICISNSDKQSIVENQKVKDEKKLNLLEYKNSLKYPLHKIIQVDSVSIILKDIESSLNKWINTYKKLNVEVGHCFKIIKKKYYASPYKNIFCYTYKIESQDMKSFSALFFGVIKNNKLLFSDSFHMTTVIEDEFFELDFVALEYIENEQALNLYANLKDINAPWGKLIYKVKGANIEKFFEHIDNK